MKYIIYNSRTQRFFKGRCNGVCDWGERKSCAFRFDSNAQAQLLLNNFKLLDSTVLQEK